MAEIDQGDDPLTAALSSRRIPKGSKRNGRGRGKGKDHGTTSTAFDPLRALGYYEVHVGSGGKSSKHRKEAQGDTVSWLEIHELTENEDGLIGTLRLSNGANELEGICVLAGSRKGLSGIVEELELSGPCTAAGDDGDQGNENRDEAEANDDDDEDEHDENDSNHGSDPDSNSISASDAKHNRRIRAFEKNSFRNPKFWLRWKGHVHHQTSALAQIPSSPSVPASKHNNEDDNNVNNPQPQLQLQPPASSQSNVETDLGYIVFATNTCTNFTGTITSHTLSWNNIKLQGWKTRSRAVPCPVRWTDVQ